MEEENQLSEVSQTPKKRGRKPKSAVLQKNEYVQSATPKKRGRKPKAQKTQEQFFPIDPEAVSTLSRMVHSGVMPQSQRKKNLRMKTILKLKSFLILQAKILITIRVAQMLKMTLKQTMFLHRSQQLMKI